MPGSDNGHVAEASFLHLVKLKDLVNSIIKSIINSMGGGGGEYIKITRT